MSQIQIEEEEEIEQQSKNSDMEILHKELEVKQKQLDWSFKESELDFPKKLFPQWNQKNVINSPYTYTLIEDVMYVDEGAIITLQYHIFNQEQDHILLTEIDDQEEGDSPMPFEINDEDFKKKKSKMKLHTDNYQKDGAHPMSIFKASPINLFDNSQPFEVDHEIGNFMTAQEKELKKEFRIEGILCFWQSYVSGKMEKMCEKSFTTKMPFAYTRKGNMTLQVTNDKKVLHLTYISNYSDQELENTNDENIKIKNDTEVKVLAWKIDVEQFTFDEEIHSKFDRVNIHLKDYLVKNQKLIHLIRSIKLTASLNYLILTYNQQQNRIDLRSEDINKSDFTQTIIPAKQNTKKISRKNAIFEVSSGQLLFEYGGCYSDLQMNSRKGKIHNLGIAIQDTTIDLDRSTIEKNKCTVIDEEISFFLVGDFINWSTNIEKSKIILLAKTQIFSETQKKKVIKDSKLEGFDWTLCVKRIKLQDIIKAKAKPQERQDWIKQEIQKHCESLSIKKREDCFQFRSNCITMREDWEASIVIQVNSHFDQIGVLNNPQVSNTHNPRCFFLYSTKAADIINARAKLNNPEWTQYDVDTMPFIIKKLPKEGLIQHG